MLYRHRLVGAALSALLLTQAAPVPASGIAFRLILGAPPDDDYQEVSYSGNAMLPPRGYSPGYGYPRDYMNMPSLVISNERPPAPGPGPLFVPQAEPNIPATAALLRVRVPEDAAVWFSGEATRQSGPQRLFVTVPLAGDQVLSYEVRARWQQQGKAVESTRRIAVHPGDRVTVDFLREAAPTEEAPPPRPLAQP